MFYQMSSWVIVGWILSVILFLMLGYIAGRLDLLLRQIKNSDSAMTATTFGKTDKSRHTTKKSISIDESKFVVDVETNYSKMDDRELGEKTVTSDDITDAKQKLAQLKRGK